MGTLPLLPLLPLLVHRLCLDMDSAERTLDYYIDGERVQTVGLQPAFNRLPPGARTCPAPSPLCCVPCTASFLATTRITSAGGLDEVLVETLSMQTMRNRTHTNRDSTQFCCIAGGPALCVLHLNPEP